MRTKTGFTELSPDALRWTCCPDLVPVESSAEARACEEIIGQERALRAIQTGLDIKSLGYNIFITGMVGTGRTTTIKQLLDQLEKADKTPDDILYVNNFKYPDEPVLIMLPAGQGKAFAEAMTKLIEMLKTNVPQLLKSPYYTDKRDALVETQQKKQRDILQAFEEEVAEQGFSVIQVQMGLFSRPDLIPVIEGQPIPFAKIEGPGQGKEDPQGDAGSLRREVRGADEQARSGLRTAQGDRRGDADAAPELGRGVHHARHPGRHRRDPGEVRLPQDRRLPRRGREEPDQEHRRLQEPEEGGEGAGRRTSSSTGSTSSWTTRTSTARPWSWRPIRTTSTSSARSNRPCRGSG